MVIFDDLLVAMRKRQQTLIKCYYGDLKSAYLPEDLKGETDVAMFMAWKWNQDKSMDELKDISSVYIRNRLWDLRRRVKTQKRLQRVSLRETDGEVEVIYPHGVQICNDSMIPYNFALVQEVLLKVKDELEKISPLHWEYVQEKFNPTDKMREIIANWSGYSTTNKISIHMMMIRFDLERWQAKRIEKDILRVFKKLFKPFFSRGQ